MFRNTNSFIIIGVIVAAQTAPAMNEYIRGNGRIHTEDRQVEALSNRTHTLIVKGSIDITLSSRGESALQIVGDSNLTPFILNEIEGSVLAIQLLEGIRVDRMPRVLISASGIRKIDASGSSSVSLNNYRIEDGLKLILKGASRAQGSLAAGSIAIDVQGASRVKLGGHLPFVSVDSVGSSSVDLGDVNGLTQATVMLTGASHATIPSAVTLHAGLSGASILNYAGSPRSANVATTGASKMNYGRR